jgi:hypothetical protein
VVLALVAIAILIAILAHMLAVVLCEVLMWEARLPQPPLKQALVSRRTFLAHPPCPLGLATM